MLRPSDGPGPQKPQRPPFVGWAVAAIFIFTIWNFGSLLFQHDQTALTIPYSAFLDQVRGGNVERVTIAGDQISGKFVKAFSPPPQGTQTPPPSPAPSPYPEFVTTYPQGVGDTGLVPLLDTHRVEINVQPPPSPLVATLLGWILPAVVFFLVAGWL